MTQFERNEQIEDAAKKYADENSEWEGDYVDAVNHFTAGADWADDNPKSRFNISDTDYVFGHLQTIINDAERMTTGNMAHNRSSILLLARDAMRKFKQIPKVTPEDKEKYLISKELFELIVSWFQWDIDMCEKITTGNVSHNIATIKAHARNSKSFIEKYSKLLDDKD